MVTVTGHERNSGCTRPSAGHSRLANANSYLEDETLTAVIVMGLTAHW